MNCYHKAFAIGVALCVVCGAVLGAGHAHSDHAHQESADARLTVVELVAPSSSSFATESGSFVLWTRSTA